MPQSAERIKDHATLFNEPEYQELFARKHALECRHSPEEVVKQAEYTKG